MSEEIHELAVKITPDGAGQTREELDNVSQQFEKTADETERSAEVMEDFSSKWKGAVGAIVGTLVLATSTLLAKVPVIGSLMSVLEGLLDVLALKLSESLRPAMDGLLVDLVEVMDAMARANGFLDALVTGITGVNEAFRDFAVDIIRQKLMNLFGIQIPESFAENVVTAFIPILRLRSALNTATTILNGVRNKLSSWWGTLKSLFSAGTASVTSDFDQFWADLDATVQEKISSIQNRAWGLYVSLLKVVDRIRAGFRTGFETLFAVIINEAKQWANSFVGIIESAVNMAVSALPKQIRSKLGLSTVDLETPFANTQSTGSILQAGRDRLARRTERAEQRAQQRREQNPFADRQEITLRIKPAELRDLFSAKIDSSVANRGE